MCEFLALSIMRMIRLKYGVRVGAFNVWHMNCLEFCGVGNVVMRLFG